MKIVYLLGAGAMIDFNGPKTAELTEDCRNLLYGLNNTHFSEIIDQLDLLYGDENYNFETIIASIEQLLNYSIATDHVYYKSIENTSVNRVIFRSEFPTLTSSSLWSCYRSLVNMIIDRVNKYDRPAPLDSIDFNKSNNPQAILRGYFSKMMTNNSLKIYSLNYDHLIPKLLSDKCIYDGTIAMNQADSKFEYDVLKFLNHSLTYFNLHGSIYLKQQPNHLYSVIQSQVPNRLDYAIPQKGGSPNELIIFSPIITGYSKSQRMMGDAFNFGFSSFFDDINTCSELIIVGYSFSDPHINSVIRTAFNLDTKKLTIVDYRDHHIIYDIENKLNEDLELDDSFKNEGGFFRRHFHKSVSGNIIVYSNGFREYMTGQILKDY